MEKEKYCNGPDQVIGDDAADKLTATLPDQAVRIRRYGEDGFEKYPPLSVPSMLKHAVKNGPKIQQWRQNETGLGRNGPTSNIMRIAELPQKRLSNSVWNDFMEFVY